MSDRGLFDLIISLLPDIPPADKISLLRGFENEQDFYVQSKKDLEKFLKREIKSFWDINDIREKAERTESVCRARSIKWVSWLDGEYPPLLREMYDPPPVIFYLGHLPNPEKSLLGMVGTRKPSPQSASHAYDIACGVGCSGISVVSGLALGIDAMSHRGNLSAGVPGYAVLGSGADEIYPSTNRMLAKGILDSGGAIISEYHPGTPPAKWNFPARNRIISALSRSVLVVEAPEKSGALITAGFALEQGRDLWVASSGIQPGLPHEQNGGLFDRTGTLKLAADGAEIIYSADDVLEKWNIKTPRNRDAAAVPQWDVSGKELASSMASFLGIGI
jgi:DNA processing protein